MFRYAFLCAAVALLAGCTPNPNMPEPPPPPPMAPAPADPPPMVNPASLPTPMDEQPSPLVAIRLPDSTDDLAKLLENDSQREAAAAALAEKGKEALPALTSALEHADWRVRAAAVFALGRMGPEAHSLQDRLKTLADSDENNTVRVAAAFALDALAE
jgi:hypothetical protein